MTKETEIFYKQEADFGIGGRPAIGDLGIVDNGAYHVCALTLNFHGLYDSGLPGEERLFAKLLEGEKIDGVVFHGFRLFGIILEYSGIFSVILGKDMMEFGGLGAIHYIWEKNYAA